jgi:hypothetical protein
MQFGKRPEPRNFWLEEILLFGIIGRDQETTNRMQVKEKKDEEKKKQMEDYVARYASRKIFIWKTKR